MVHLLKEEGIEMVHIPFEGQAGRHVDRPADRAYNLHFLLKMERPRRYFFLKKKRPRCFSCKANGVDSLWPLR